MPEVVMTDHVRKTVGIVARFDNPGKLMEAAKKVRDSGYSKFDCHSPFPIHGMDTAMGLGRSQLGWLIGVAALIGTSSALGLQWWTSTIDYPLVISGKPLFSYQAYVPVTFALGVLLSAFAALIGMLAFNGLPRWNHPVFNSTRFESATDDALFISILSDDQKFDEAETKQLLESIGGKDCEHLTESEN
jgi:ActD protein